MQNSDALIIGGGIIGLAIARELRKRDGGRITVIERGLLGKEASWAAAGILAPQAEADAEDEFFQLCSESNELYPQFAAELLDESGVDVELDRTGTIYLAFSDEDLEELDRRYEWQARAGLAVERLSQGEIKRHERLISPAAAGGLLFPNDGQVENRRLVEALAAYCRKNDIGIFENAEARRITPENQNVVHVETTAGRFSAAHVVVAAGAWTPMLEIGADRKLRIPVKPIRGQMISYSGRQKDFRHVIYSHRGYLVPRSDGRLLVGATVEDAGFNKGLTEDGVASLESAAAEIAPNLRVLRPSEKWAGLRPFATDELPVIGSWPEISNLTIATGHYRNGILLAPLTARIIADKLIDGVGSDYFDAFGPARFLTASAR